MLGTLRGRAAVCEGPGGTLVVIDLHAARERLIAHRLGEERAAPPAAPLVGALGLTAAMQRRVAARLEEFATAGLVVEPFGPNTFRLVGVPPALVARPPEALVEAAVAALEGGSRGGGGSRRARLRRGR